MTSDGTFPNRFTKVDDLTRPDHWHLTETDACYFIGEYTAREGYAFSDTNQLIWWPQFVDGAPERIHILVGQVERPA